VGGRAYKHDARRENDSHAPESVVSGCRAASI
jgi:hypothetical protein